MHMWNENFVVIVVVKCMYVTILYVSVIILDVSVCVYVCMYF